MVVVGAAVPLHPHELLGGQRRGSAAAMPARTTDPAQDLSGSAPLRSGQPLARADAGGWLSGCRAAPVVKISRRAAAPGPN